MISTRGPPGAASSSPFFVASGVSRIIILRRAGEKLRKIREFEPTHVGCYVMIGELDAALRPASPALQNPTNNAHLVNHRRDNKKYGRTFYCRVTFLSFKVT